MPVLWGRLLEAVQAPGPDQPVAAGHSARAGAAELSAAAGGPAGCCRRALGPGRGQPARSRWAVTVSVRGARDGPGPGRVMACGVCLPVSRSRASICAGAPARGGAPGLVGSESESAGPGPPPGRVGLRVGESRPRARRPRRLLH
jgi:hypothetical protein